MSKISTAYDYVISALGTEFSSHKRLSNPYSLDQNPSRILEQAYGLAVLGGLNTNLEITCTFSVQRTMRIVLTRKFFSLENDPSQKASTEKTLLEDQYALINLFEGDHTLGANVIKFVYASDNGIEAVFSDKDQYLFIATDFTMEYIETIT